MAKLVSIVTPMYNEGEMVAIYFEKLNKITAEITAKNKDIAFEIVVTNDGSRDDTFDKLIAQTKIQKNLRVVNLSRNFGQEPAVFAGVDAAKGDAIIVMDADLQDPVELLELMIDKWREGYDVVNAKRKSRKVDSFFQRVTAKYYYKKINQLSYKVKYPVNVNNFRLISRRVAEVIKTFPSNEKIFRNAVAQAGFKTAEIEFVRAKREGGKSTNNKKAMIRLSLVGISDASVKPLHFGFGWSILMAVAGFLGIAQGVGIGIAAEVGVTWAQTLTQSWLFNLAVWFFLIMMFTGAVLFVLSINNFYLGKAFTEIKGRPMYIVEGVYGA